MFLNFSVQMGTGVSNMKILTPVWGGFVSPNFRETVPSLKFRKVEEEDEGEEEEEGEGEEGDASGWKRND